MNIVYILLILLQLGIIIYFIRRGRIQKGKATQPATDRYDGLRALALGVKAADLKIAVPATETLVYGMVMDWNMGDVTATLAAYINGAANMYLSKGGGVSGAGPDTGIAQSALDLVTFIQDYLDRAMPAATTDLPAANCVRFFLLTNKGLYAAQEQMTHFDDDSSAWLPVFEKANLIITAMRREQTPAS